MKYPSIWYTIWLLEALPVVCNTVYVKTFLYFTLLYSRLFLWVEEAQEGLQNDISWCNSDRLIWTLNLEQHVQFFPNNMDYFSIELSMRGYHIYKETMLKNNCHANVRMATVLISLFRWLSSEINERYWPHFVVHVSVYSLLHQQHMQDSLRKGTQWISHTVNKKQIVKHSPT